MTALMKECCDELLEVLESTALKKKSFEAREVFLRMAMDVNMTATFGMKTDVQQRRGHTPIDALLDETQRNLKEFRTGWLLFIMGTSK